MQYISFLLIKAFNILIISKTDIFRRVFHLNNREDCDDNVVHSDMMKIFLMDINERLRE